MELSQSNQPQKRFNCPDCGTGFWTYSGMVTHAADAHDLTLIAQGDEVATVVQLIPPRDLSAAHQARRASALRSRLGKAETLLEENGCTVIRAEALALMTEIERVRIRDYINAAYRRLLREQP